jgi:hypothetical protein
LTAYINGQDRGERGEDMRGESTGKVRVREDSRVTGFGRTVKRGQK